MSEEICNQEVSIGFASAGDNIEIEFADGVRKVPDRVVEYLGIENLEKPAHLLNKKSFNEIYARFQSKSAEGLGE